MNRQYHKLVYERYNLSVDVEEAIRQGEYRKIYYFEDNSIGRIDEYAPDDGLIKVSYQQTQPPFESEVDAHFEKHPDVLCEFVTPSIRGADGLHVVQSYLYLPSKVLDRRYEGHFADSGKLVKRISIGLDGQRGDETHQVYDEKGRLVKAIVYDASGRLIREIKYGEPWPNWG
jgi:hypothetical protein